MIARLFDIDTRNMALEISDKKKTFVHFCLVWNNPPDEAIAKEVLLRIKSQKTGEGLSYFCYGMEGLDEGKTKHLQIYIHLAGWNTTCRSIYTQIQKQGHSADVRGARGKSKLRK